MLKRKIETYLTNWKRSEGRKPLVIKGIRQCGKTYIVQKLQGRIMIVWSI